MISRAPTLSSAQFGFSLVEMMIAMVLGLLIIGGASSVFLSNKQSYRTGEALSRIQEGSRNAFELIARDIRDTALTGCGNSGRMANVVTNSGTTWWANWSSPIIGFSGSGSGGADSTTALTTGTASTNHVTGSDSVVLLGADDMTYSASVAADGSASAPFQTNETAALAVGDVIIACTTGGGAALQQATIAQITNIPTAGSYITGLTGATPGNCSTGLGYPTNCTTANIFTFPYASTLISKLKSVSWYLGVNPLGGTNYSLYRMVLVNNAGTAGTQAQEMVRGVTSFLLTYHYAGQTDFVTAANVGTANWATVDAVRISVTLQAADRYAAANATAGTNSKVFTRTTVATVALRNRVN